MPRFRSSLNGLTLAALLGAAGLGLPPAFLNAAVDKAAPALFAPPGSGPAQQRPEAGEAAPTAPKSDPAPAAPATPPAKEAPSPGATGPRPGPQGLPKQESIPAAAVPAASSSSALNASPHVIVDAQGNKTLVIHGDQAPQVIMDEPGGGQVQVLIGDDTAGLVMDSQGRKTLVVRGDLEPPRSEGSPEPSPRPSPTPAKSGPTAPVQEIQPYWLVESTENSRPYWEMEPAPEAKPYWVKEETEESRPYWEVAKAADSSWPYYWLPEPEVAAPPEIELSPAVQDQTPGRPLAAPPSQENQTTIAYYMYRDERGVPQITNIPDDPRYRLFTAVVTVQRGLSGTGPRIRFTHETLRPIIMEAARIYNLDPALIAAVIKSESAFDSRAVSWAGAQGLMQLMPATAREMGVRDPFDPQENVMGGSRYLRKMLDHFGGDLTLAIAAYNCGPNRVAKLWRVPNIAETQNYVVIVRRNYDRYRLMF